MKKREFLAVLLCIGALALIAFGVVKFLPINPTEIIHQVSEQETDQEKNQEKEAGELLSAITAYVYEFNGKYPWNIVTEEFQDGPHVPVASFSSEKDGLDWIRELVDKGKLAADTADKILADGVLHLYKDLGLKNFIYVCFLPESRDLQQQAALACQNNEIPRAYAVDICVTNDGSLSFEGKVNQWCLSVPTPNTRDSFFVQTSDSSSVVIQIASDSSVTATESSLTVPAED